MFNRRDLMALPTAMTLGGLATNAMADVEPRSMIRLLKPGQAAEPCQLIDLKWLEGYWLGQMPFGPVEHVKLPIKFGHMPGFVRAVNNEGVVFYEIVVFAQVGDTIAQQVKHFGVNLEGWEPRESRIQRLLVERKGDSYFFDGITLARTGPDSYTVFYLERDGEKEKGTLVVPFKRVSRLT